MILGNFVSDIGYFYYTLHTPVLMGGWGIWETVNGEQKLTTECIENVIMMVPFSAIVIWNNWRIDVLCGDEGKKVSGKMYEIVIY